MAHPCYLIINGAGTAPNIEKELRTMKKILSVVLALIMLLSCGATLAEGRELTVGNNMAPQNISPFTNFTNRQPVMQYLYETLALKDSATGELYGVIAKSWTTEDNINYDFEIYDYVYDTEGNHITAADCVFSLEHGRDEAAVTWIASVEQTGDYTFRLTATDDSVSTFPTIMERAVIVSQAAYEAASDGMSTSAVGTGAYMVTDFVPNVSITLEKNPNYWQTDEALQCHLYKEMTVDTLRYTKIAEASQQTIALETGAIDVFEKIANTEVANFVEGGRDADNFTAIANPTDTTYVLYFAAGGQCGADVNLRKAISYAIDKEMLVLGALDGNAVVPNFMGAMGGMSDLTPTTENPDYFNYDPAKAAEFLGQSSYKGEEIRLLVPNEDNHNRLAAIVQGYLMASGINCKIESYDNAMFQSAFGDKNAWDVAICQMGMRDVAFVWGFLSYKYSGGEQGAAGMAVQDEKFDELLGTVMSVDGHTNENATLLSDYINEMAYGEALVNTTSYWIFRKDIGAVAVPRPDTIDHYIACTQFE